MMIVPARPLLHSGVPVTAAPCGHVVSDYSKCLMPLIKFVSSRGFCLRWKRLSWAGVYVRACACVSVFVSDSVIP